MALIVDGYEVGVDYVTEIPVDRLEEIFEMQATLMKEIERFGKVPLKERLVATGVALIGEATEYLNEIHVDHTLKPWKRHVNTDNAKEELADVLFFLIQLCELSGISSNELFEVYRGKYHKNLKRLKERAVNLDGTSEKSEGP